MLSNIHQYQYISEVILQSLQHQSEPTNCTTPLRQDGRTRRDLRKMAARRHANEINVDVATLITGSFQVQYFTNTMYES